MEATPPLHFPSTLIFCSKRWFNLTSSAEFFENQRLGFQEVPNRPQGVQVLDTLFSND